MRHLLLPLLVLASSAVTAAESTPATDLAVVAERFEREQRALRLAFRAQERPPVSAADLVEQVGGEPAELHRAVHERTWWVPYRGSLRGVTGTLVDGSASHLDRALLLGRALQAAGYEVRLHRGTLAEETVAEVLPGALARARERGAELPATGLHEPELETRFAAELETDLASFRADRERLALRSQEAQEEVLLRTLAQSARLRELLGDELGDAGADAAAIFADHWWVVYRAEGAEAWRVLDPLQPPERAGEAPTASARELALGDDEPLPAELRHRLRVRAVAETWSDGERHEHVLLEHELDPRELWLESLQMVCLPLGWSPGDELADADPAALEAALLEQEQWWPLLAVGEGDTIRQAAIDHRGAVDERPAERAEHRKLEKGIGALAAMGEQDAGALFTALWWEFTWLGPQADERPQRRAVMDVIGPAARAAGAPGEALGREQRVRRARQLGTISQAACLTGRPSPAVVRRLAMVWRLRNQEAMLGTLDALQREDDATVVDRLSAIKVPAIQLKNWALLRWAWSPHRGRSFVDRPQVLALHVLPDGAGQMRMAIDVIANGVGVLPPDPDDAQARSAGEVRLEQGILDTVLEGLALRGYGEALGANPSSLMAEDPEAWQRVADPAALELDADWRQRLADDRADGFVVVAPADPVGEMGMVGWWRIDPTSGETLGLGVNGWGPEGAEEISVLATMTRAQIAVLRVNMFLAHNYHRIAFLCAICKIGSMGLTMGGVNLPPESDLACGVLCAGVGEE